MTHCRREESSKEGRLKQADRKVNIMWVYGVINREKKIIRSKYILRVFK
jgi:hypothetical protein